MILKSRTGFFQVSDPSGCHVYKDIWEASHGKLLNCARETGKAYPVMMKWLTDVIATNVDTGFDCTYNGDCSKHSII